jgi:alpha,alpha-trehalose phosphorylase
MSDMEMPDSWQLVEDRFDLTRNAVHESLFSLGNGYLGMRGTFEEGLYDKAGRPGYSVEGTYINGFYETQPIPYGEKLAGFAEVDQTILNVANSKLIRLQIENAEFGLLTGEVLAYRRELNLRTGLLNRHIRWRSPEGKIIQITITRAVLFARPHRACISYTVVPLNFDGAITLSSGIDGSSPKDNGAGTGDHDPRLAGGPHQSKLVFSHAEATDEAALTVQQVEPDQFSVACGIRHHLTSPQGYSAVVYEQQEAVGMVYTVPVKKDQAVTLHKFMAYMTSFDVDAEHLVSSTQAHVEDACEVGIDALHREQAAYLEGFWQHAEIAIDGDDEVEQGLRLGMFHLLQSTGTNGRASIAAKGLTGQGYQGHYFWDTEIYVLPFFVYTRPAIARALLEFRFHTLENARRRARQMSHSRGALYPWRTINGDECSSHYPTSTAQYHINADIAFAIQRYLDATDDWDFMTRYGAEILFETARLWIECGHFDALKGGRFCIHGVTGPDEYTILINNNAYTNLMAREHLRFAYDTHVGLAERAPQNHAMLAQRIGLLDTEPESWKQAAEMMYVPYDEDKRITPQDDSFLNKPVWDFDNTPQTQYPLLLHYHPLILNRYQVCKQADVLLAEFLLSDQFDPAQKQRDYDYYERITTHDSSLSGCIFAIIAAEIGYPRESYRFFRDAVMTDLHDKKGNTKDGVHTANMAGAWMAVVFGFGGMRAAHHKLSFQPMIPDEWKSYRFSVTYLQRLLRVAVDHQRTEIRLVQGEPLEIQLSGERLLLSEHTAVSKAR